MQKIKSFLKNIALVTILTACNTTKTDIIEAAKQEIAKAEKDFAQMVAEKGIAEGFYFFADSNATIRRQNDTLIHGKENIKSFYSTSFFQNATVKWSPDFVDASANGDMGYTYGQYEWESKDSTGKIETFHGVFHTVWKKQPDGNWKYVWD